MRYRPNPDSRLEAYEWTGDITVIPKAWRDLAGDLGSGFVIADDGTLNVPTPHGYASGNLGWYVAQDEAGGFYVISRAVMLARWIPEEAGE